MKPIEVADGEIITQPGIYRMSMSWYHSQCCDGPSISSSGLRKIWTESPYHFWTQSDLNPDRLPEKDSGDALVLGRAAHALILGDEVFEDHFAYVPADAPPRPTAAQEKARKDGRVSDAAKERFDFWDGFLERADGKMLVSEGQLQTIWRIANGIAARPEIKELLVGPLMEVSLIWQDVTGVWIKARPDMIPTNGADFSDLKTFAPRSKSVKRAIHQAITDHRYDMQLALAVEGAEQIGIGTAETCALVMCQTTQPYTVSAVQITADTLYLARCCNRKAIDTFAHGLKTGEWPQPIEGIMEYSLPPSIAARYYEMQASGELPNIGEVA